MLIITKRSGADLPAPSVAAATALAIALDRCATAHPDSTLAALERGVLGIERTHLPALAHAVLQRTVRTLASLPLRCPQGQHAATIHGWRRRQVLTTCGLLSWERPWAICVRCQQWFGAGDATLALAPAQRQSAGVAALVVARGSVTTFREAAQLLELTTGLALSHETLRRTTESAGATLAEQQDAATTTSAAGVEPAVVDPAPGVLVAATDGVLVRDQDGWHELKIGVVGGWVATAASDAAAAGRLTAPSYVAARADSTVFADRCGAEVARRGGLAVVGWHGPQRGVAALRPVVVLGDGAQWIWVTVASQFGAVIALGDFFHACEQLTTVAALLHGVGSPAAAAWAADRREELRTQGVDGIVPHLAAPAGLTADVLDTLHTEQGYFRTNQARMQYPSFRAQGLPMGSGAVESSAKHLIQQRLKRAGMRWSDRGGRALIALRAHHATPIGLAAYAVNPQQCVTPPQAAPLRWERGMDSNEADVRQGSPPRVALRSAAG